MTLKEITFFARDLRKNPTPAEYILWQRLRRRQILGFKFLRQFPIEWANNQGNKSFFVPDFYCHEKRLIIELDGSVHQEQVEYDQFREEVLKEMGYKILRFRNEELNDIRIVLRKIIEHLRDFDPPPTSPSQREGSIPEEADRWFLNELPPNLK